LCEKEKGKELNGKFKELNGMFKELNGMFKELSGIAVCEQKGSLYKGINSED